MTVIPLKQLAPSTPSKYDFAVILQARGIELSPLSIETLQVNITKLCNQACRHCHVDSSPARTEKLSREGVEKCVEILARHPQIRNLDITGGAPQLRQGLTLFGNGLAHPARLHAHLFQQRLDGAALLVQERLHQVYRLDEIVIFTHGQRLGIGQSGLQFSGELVDSHA